MNARSATITRKTTETDIAVEVKLDGTGTYRIDTGFGFLNHMLGLFSKHSLIDLTVQATGDLHIDQHHTAEDVNICLVQALKQVSGEKKGIQR